MRLEEQNSPLRYFGFNLDQAATFKTMLKDMRSQVWAFWDESRDAPAKTRPAPAEAQASAPSLEILAWDSGRPVWPSVLDTRFPEGTEEFTELMKQKKAFHEKYPVQARSTTTSSQAVAVAHPRAGGQCDYSLDGGTAPLDTTRELDLLAVSDGDFTVNRLEWCVRWKTVETRFIWSCFLCACKVFCFNNILHLMMHVYTPVGLPLPRWRMANLPLLSRTAWRFGWETPRTRICGWLPESFLDSEQVNSRKSPRVAAWLMVHFRFCSDFYVCFLKCELRFMQTYERFWVALSFEEKKQRIPKVWWCDGPMISTSLPVSPRSSFHCASTCVS